MLKSPYPFFGGKSTVAGEVWKRFGAVKSYIEPFFGGGAVLLGKPDGVKCVEVVNDLDCFIACFWRAIPAEPEAVAAYADWPVNEVDIEARHKWLCEHNRKKEFTAKMRNDPDYYDVKVAGWWVHGISAWIGTGYCEGEWFGEGDKNNHGSGININGGKLPNLVKVAGVHRKSLENKLPRLAEGEGVHRKSLANKLPCLTKVAGIQSKRCSNLSGYFQSLSDRLRRVRVCCGDWARVISPAVLNSHPPTGIFLDPPYGAERAVVYAEESFDVAGEVLTWCVENGANPQLRIALCGYEGEHNELEKLGWKVFLWKANGGYSNLKKGAVGQKNKELERIWFSPACNNDGGLWG